MVGKPEAIHITGGGRKGAERDRLTGALHSRRSLQEGSACCAIRVPEMGE